MKLSESFRFPYPVLTEMSSDYLTDQIDLLLSIEERPADASLRLSYELQIDSATMQSELASGASVSFLSVVCRDSFYNEFFEISDNPGLIKVEGGNLYGRVEVRAVVVRLSDGYLEATGLQPDYLTSKFELPAGAVTAWTLPRSFSAGMEKLAPMESIFRLALDESLEEGTFGVSYDEEYITVRAPKKLLETIHAMRGSAFARPIVLNSIYVPAVMAVLDAFKDGSEFVDRRWFRVVQAKAEHLGLDLVNGNSLEVVQRLLKSPAARLTQFMEKSS